jgi:dolichyl-phosphate-mannose--protein O-mannosyl transferase
MKWKRALAIAGLVLICSLYLIALVLAFSHSAESKKWLMAAIYSTVVIPVFIYAAQLVVRVIRPNDNHNDTDTIKKE